MAASGIKLNAANAESFDQATSRIKAAAQSLDDAKKHFEGVNSALRFAGDQLMDVFDKVGQKGQTWQQTMTSVLQAVEKQMLQAAITVAALSANYSALPATMARSAACLVAWRKPLASAARALRAVALTPIGRI